MLYLVRHAQSLPRAAQPQPSWGLSPVGHDQARHLAPLLAPLGIQRVFSSPFIRSLETAAPFAQSAGFGVVPVSDLRERIPSEGSQDDLQKQWCRSWEDFAFAPPGGETSFAAQARFTRAVQDLAENNPGTIAVFSHGHVIALFLNAINHRVGRREAESLTNPDVVKVEWQGGVFSWDRRFRLLGLDAIASPHAATPKEA